MTSVSKIVDMVLKEAVNISELSSGYLKDRTAIEKTWNVMRGEEPLEVGNKTYKAKGPVKGSQLAKGMIVLATYSSTNQGTDLYEILGIADDDTEEVKYASVKEAMKVNNLMTLKAMEDIEEKKPFRLVVKNLEDNTSGAWFYLFQGRWSRGSGAEKLSFVLMEETHASSKKQSGFLTKVKNYGKELLDPRTEQYLYGEGTPEEKEKLRKEIQKH